MENITSKKLGRDNIIVYYHSVGTEHLSVATDEFEKQIFFLRSQYLMTTVSDLLYRHYTNNETKGLCAISFDDCFQSVFFSAIPILNKYNISSTCYAVVKYTGQSLWGDRKSGTWSENKSPRYNIEFPIMGWAELKELVLQGHEIGCHTYSHPNLDQCPNDVLIHEMVTSKKILENKLNVVISSFAYPRGRFGVREKRIIANSNYSNAVTTIVGPVIESVDILSICRIPSPSNALALKDRYCPKYILPLKYVYRKVRRTVMEVISKKKF